MQRVAVVLEEGLDVGHRDVGLAHEHRLALPAHRVLAQRVQPALALVGVDAGDADLLDEEGHGVHPESRRAQRQPEADDLRDLVADGGIGDVQVGLKGQEAVQVELSGLGVPGPLLRRGALLGRGVVAPHVVVAKGRRAIRARRAKPRVLVGGVVDHEVDDHAQAAVARVADGVDDVAEIAQPRIDRRGSR